MIVAYLIVATFPACLVGVCVFYWWDTHRWPKDPALVEDRQVADLDRIWELS